MVYYGLFLLYHVLPTLYYVIPKNKQLPYGDDIHHWLSLMTDSPWGFWHGFPTKSVPIRSIASPGCWGSVLSAGPLPPTSDRALRFGSSRSVPGFHDWRLWDSRGLVELPAVAQESVGDLHPICWICWDGKPELERKDTAKENCRKELDGKLQKNHTSKKMKPARRLLLGSQLSLICPLGNLHNGPEASFLRYPSDDRRRIESWGWGKQPLRRSHPSFREGGHDNLFMPKRLNHVKSQSGKVYEDTKAKIQPRVPEMLGSSFALGAWAAWAAWILIHGCSSNP